MRRSYRLLLSLFAAALLTAGPAVAQVTTSSITGRVTDPAGNPLGGATVTAVHQPSGTRYGTTTREDGRYTIAGMRVGGPYLVTASRVGYGSQARQDVSLALGVAAGIEFVLSETAIALEGVTVTAENNSVLSSERTGAATSVGREAIAVVPTIQGRLSDVAKLTPQAGRGLSFAGQDTRLNNITIDGAYFNNSFGLGGSAEPGGRSGVAPISLDAVEQVQINIAPFDVRQGNFVGAGVNTVTRSGTNEFRGSLKLDYRDEALVGNQAGPTKFDPGTFDYSEFGAWLSGPVVRDKLFFFVNLERERLVEPATLFLANNGNDPVGGNQTRVLRSDLERISSFLATNFDYETGPFEGYQSGTPATRFLGKLDYNLNQSNKFSLRYLQLDADRDNLISNSRSLGFGNRRTNTSSLSFLNSGYGQGEKIRSLVGEWNSTFGNDFANQFIAGYTYHDESRTSRGKFFPLVDILEDGATYTSFGFEPFTPNNELRYGQFQLQNNLTRFGVAHTLTFGASLERYESENVFFPGSQSAYVYNSLEDFFTDANDYLANPNRTTSPVQLRSFQVRYSNIPGQDKPVQPLEVLYAGIYGQDEWQATDALKLTLGARLDVPFFGDTGFDNPEVTGLSFRNEDGSTAKYRTDDLPDPNPLFSPRVGFNWDVRGDRSTQLRGGTGIFTGKPAYVWISNQIGENGILTGFDQLTNTRLRPFNPDPNFYKPSEVSGQPARSYGLAFTDPDFRFPQVWRSNLALDQRLPLGLIGTVELLYGRDVNGVYYINANLPEAQTAFAGADARPRFTDNRLNNNITSAIVLKNQNEGYSYNVSGSLERQFRGGVFAKGGYAYGEAFNTIDPGNIAFGSWASNPVPGDPNNPPVARSGFSPGHRVFGALSYRAEYLRLGATTLSVFGEGITAGFASYTYSGDFNGDGARNDLIYVPRDASEMNFVTFRSSGRTFTAAEQAAAFDQFIERDAYLRTRRGQYAERNGARLPMEFRLDASLTQELFTNLGGRRNGLQLRADVLNFGNLINEDLGVGRRFVTVQPLVVPSSREGGAVDRQGRAQYRLQNVRDQLITEASDASTEFTAGLSDVWRVQFSLRYTLD